MINANNKKINVPKGFHDHRICMAAQILIFGHWNSVLK